MLRFFSAIFLALSIALSASADLSFAGALKPVVAISPASSSGLDAVYVVIDAHGVSISDSSGATVNWSSFGPEGAAYATELGSASSVALTDADRGYVVEVDGRPHYYWVVNYANHPMSLESVTPAPDPDDCMRLPLEIVGTGAAINYYSITGRQIELSRDIKVSYSNLEYSDDDKLYRQVDVVETLSSLKPVIHVNAPTCNTAFTVSGDRFLEFWDEAYEIVSPVMEAFAIDAHTFAEQHTREIDNEQSDGSAELGGSAPCEIDFSAVVTDAASFVEWQLADNPDFDPIDDRYPSTDFSRTFTSQGTTYVRFFAANAQGTCPFTGPVYQVSIGESSLLCPNAFSPESSPGVNDEWRVSYKSIISFECHIFNRWGTEMCSFRDPAQGWDGRYKGKYVPAGTYYYIIKARGADGKVYNLSGDINIIKAKTPSAFQDSDY